MIGTFHVVVTTKAKTYLPSATIKQMEAIISAVQVNVPKTKSNSTKTCGFHVIIDM
jgi:hypothetical protein